MAVYFIWYKYPILGIGCILSCIPTLIIVYASVVHNGNIGGLMASGIAGSDPYSSINPEAYGLFVASGFATVFGVLVILLIYGILAVSKNGESSRLEKEMIGEPLLGTLAGFIICPIIAFVVAFIVLNTASLFN